MKTALFSVLLAMGCATGSAASRGEREPACVPFDTFGIKICDSLGVTTKRSWDWPGAASCPDNRIASATWPTIIFTDARSGALMALTTFDREPDGHLYIEKYCDLLKRSGYSVTCADLYFLGPLHARWSDFIGLSFGVGDNTATRGEARAWLIPGSDLYAVLVGIWPTEFDEVMERDFHAIVKGIQPSLNHMKPGR